MNAEVPGVVSQILLILGMTAVAVVYLVTRRGGQVDEARLDQISEQVRALSRRIENLETIITAVDKSRDRAFDELKEKQG